jgi:hypothetical protein
MIGSRFKMKSNSRGHLHVHPANFCPLAPNQCGWTMHFAEVGASI